jgi:hypothetical protein
MKLRREPKRSSGPPSLPKRSETVTLVRSSGERLQARIADRGIDSLLVVIMFKPERPMTETELGDIALEFGSEKGRVRVHGTVVFEDGDLLRFTELTSVEILQQREYVRVKSTRPVILSVGSGQRPIQTFSVDLSGGGILLAGPSTLRIGERVEIRLTTTPDSTPIIGKGIVVRSDERGHRAICFESISDGDHRRLVRFIFECQRVERQRGLASEGASGGGHGR